MDDYKSCDVVTGGIKTPGMKTIKFSLLCCVFIFGIFGCTNIAISATPMPTSLLSAASTELPTTPTIKLNVSTATPTPTLSPSNTPTVSPTVQPSPIPTKTEIETRQSFQRQCIRIDEKPQNIAINGALVIDSSKIGIYFLDLADFTRYIFPLTPNAGIPNDYSVSPDGKWLAYNESFFDDRGHLESLQLRLINAHGERKMLSYWTKNWQNILGWSDNDRLMLSQPGLPDSAVTILNPFTGQWQKNSPEIPDIHPAYEVVYDPSLKYAVYTNSKDKNIHLWDIQAQKSLWQKLYSDWAAPSWSPDGKQMGISYGKSIFLINLDGKETELLNMARMVSEHQYSSTDIGEFSWSPDGSKIAVWLGDPAKLTLIDINTKQITDLCITSDIFYWELPIWSPDGRFVATATWSVDNFWRYKSNSVIVSIDEGYAIKVVEDAEPLAWLLKP